ncbi:MAG: hypothetical protein COA96_02910 [SAR86 cluster bacterium]|uniref:HTH cro/C1-type domain-containing protein n=1 Tax=SAR86 cluster bacterium TaxID=2030880 RepID=A0A2A5B7L0_9GAMM|nr:MAG: hypothetical protein COA96_02910 [SAR86 cluster bacterium]
MDLRINAEKIRTLRKDRAWSQEHLAHVAGLGRRTVQRIEKTGFASYESAQAIAAVLDLAVSDFALHDELPVQSSKVKHVLLRRISLALSSIVALLLFLMGQSITADQIQLDIEATSGEENETRASVTSEEGEEVQVQITGDHRITITPTIAGNGDVRLEVILMRLQGEEYIRVGRPILQTPDGEAALIKSATGDGQFLTLEITPRII